MRTPFLVGATLASVLVTGVAASASPPAPVEVARFTTAYQGDLSGPVLAGNKVVWGQRDSNGTVFIRSAQPGLQPGSATRTLFQASNPQAPKGLVPVGDNGVVTQTISSLAASGQRIVFVRAATLYLIPKCLQDIPPCLRATRWFPLFADLWVRTQREGFQRIAGGSPPASSQACTPAKRWRPTSVDVSGVEFAYAEQLDGCRHYYGAADYPARSRIVLVRNGHARVLKSVHDAYPLTPVRVAGRYLAWGRDIWVIRGERSRPAWVDVYDTRTRTRLFTLSSQQLTQSSGSIAFDLDSQGRLAFESEQQGGVDCYGPILVGWLSAKLRHPRIFSTLHAEDFGIRISNGRMLVLAEQGWEGCSSLTPSAQFATVDLRGRARPLLTYQLAQHFVPRGAFDLLAQRYAFAWIAPGATGGPPYPTSILLGNAGRYGQAAKVGLSLHGAPVAFSNVRLVRGNGTVCLTPCLSRPGRLLKLEYDLNEDARITAVVKNPYGTIVRTLATDDPVSAGTGNSISWNGLTQDGTAPPDDLYTLSLTAVDAGGNTASAQGQIILDGSGPTIIFPKSHRLTKREKLVVRFADLHGVRSGSLSVNHRVVRKLRQGRRSIVYRPRGGWRKGRYRVLAIGTDWPGNRTRLTASFHRR